MVPFLVHESTVQCDNLTCGGSITELRVRMKERNSDRGRFKIGEGGRRFRGRGWASGISMPGPPSETGLQPLVKEVR